MSTISEPVDSKGEGILHGIKVVDFGWAIVAPLTATYLGFLGATVVTIESTKAIDALRLAGPFKDNASDVDMNGFFANHNPGKYGITLNLKGAEGLDVTKRLIKWADVLVENFAPGVMNRLGLNYKAVRAMNPSIIYTSSSQLGQNGPLAQFKAMGVQGAALAGLYAVAGWPDGDPTGPFGAYTDYVAPKYLLAAILAALLRRKRTGEGQFIEQSQVEAGLNFIAPALLDYSVNGRVLQCPGNHSPEAAPHSVFPCKGDDRWCVIAVFTDGEWKALCHVLGDPSWASDKKYSTFLGRKRNEEALESLIGEWTKNRSAEEVMEILQGAGVPAGMVAKPGDLHKDAQLVHRKYYRVINHPKIGPQRYDSPAFRFSDSISGPTKPAPCVGQHTKHICIEFLGMTEEEFESCKVAGAFS